jgi:hypothetical protein
MSCAVERRKLLEYNAAMNHNRNQRSDKIIPAQ